MGCFWLLKPPPRTEHPGWSSSSAAWAGLCLLLTSALPLRDRFPPCRCLSYRDIKLQRHCGGLSRELVHVHTQEAQPQLGAQDLSPCQCVPALTASKHCCPSQPALQSCQFWTYFTNCSDIFPSKGNYLSTAAAQPARATLCSRPGSLGLHSRESHRCIHVTLVKSHYSALSGVGQPGSEQQPLVLPNLLIPLSCHVQVCSF